MRKVFIVTERRADFSRFKPILEELRNSDEFEYDLVVTGLHLLKNHGFTIDEIKAGGYDVFTTFDMYKEELAKDDGCTMVQSLGVAIEQLALILDQAKPDIVLSGFDIAANFAVTIAAAHMNIPVAHIQGGEVTGTIDESLRHAMSKFAHYHLVSNEDAKERLIKMGEVPDNVFVVGCPSIDALLEVNDVSDEDLQQEFGIDFTEPYFIVIQHPVTTEFEQSEFQIQTTLGAIKESNAQALFIYPNNDAGAQNIIKTLKKSKIKHVPTLSLEKYVSLLRRSAGLIGNSSSGIHETATLSVPTINIGSRQQGRLRPTNVVDVEHNQTQIVGAIDRCLNDDEFLETVKTCTNPYGDGLSAKKIVDILKTIDISDNIIQKQITY